MAIIVDQGIRDMMVDQKDVFYYITLMNENYAQPTLAPGVEQDVIRGCYLFDTYGDVKAGPHDRITLLGSGAILTEVIKAARILAERGKHVSVMSVTSWSELARDGIACEQAALQQDDESRVPFLYRQLQKSAGPIVAATDYVRALPESVRAYVPSSRRYCTLGTDGFGRSDTRAALRAYFGVDADTIVRTALRALR